jgi:hypothetical protein
MTTGRPGRARTVLGALALVLALGSCAAPADRAAVDGIPGAPAGRTADPAGPRAGIDVPATPPAAPGFEVAEAPRRLSMPGPPSPPVRLAIPAIGVATPLVRLGRERDGSMQVRTTSPAPAGSPKGPPPVRWGRR